MKSVSKLIKQVFLLLFVTLVLIIGLNLALMGHTILSNWPQDMSPYTLADSVAEEFQANNYSFDEELEKTLIENQAWAIYVEDSSHQVSKKQKIRLKIFRKHFP